MRIPLLFTGALALICVAGGWGGCSDDSNGDSACGNGVVEGDEACDGEDVGDQTCESLGFHGGEVLCTSDCTVDLSLCELVGRCGDGFVQQPHEQCDSTQMTDEPCAAVDPAFSSGVASCGADCTYDVSQCGICGDDAMTPGEPCDDGNAEPWDGCHDCEIVEFTVASVDATGYNAYPHTAISGNGSIVVAQPVGDGELDQTAVLHYFDAQGVHTVAATAVTDDIGWLGGLAMDAQGGFVATYFQRQTHQLLIQRYTAALERDGTPIVVASDSLGKDFPDIDMTADGTMVVSWASRVTAGNWSADVYLRVYTPSGVPVGGAVLVSAPPSGDRQSPKVAISETGRIVVGWLHENNWDNEAYHVRFFDALGTPDGTAVVIASADDEELDEMDLDMGADGRAVVVWSMEGVDWNVRDVFAQRLSPAGTLAGPPILVNDATLPYHFGSAVAVADDGSFAVTWGEIELNGYAGRGAMLRWFDAQGIAAAAPQQVSVQVATLAAFTSVARAGGRTVMTWATYPYVFTPRPAFYGQRFDDQENPQGLMPW